MKIAVTLFSTLAVLVAMPAFAARVVYSYDDAGRLAQVDYGDGKVVAYTYDNNGNVLSVTVTADPGMAAAPVKAPSAPPALRGSRPAAARTAAKRPGSKVAGRQKDAEAGAART